MEDDEFATCLSFSLVWLLSSDNISCLSFCFRLGKSQFCVLDFGGVLRKYLVFCF